MGNDKVTVTGKIHQGYVAGGKIHILFPAGTSHTGTNVYQAHPTDWEFLCQEMAPEEGIIFPFITLIHESKGLNKNLLPDTRVFIERILEFDKIR